MNISMHHTMKNILGMLLVLATIAVVPGAQQAARAQSSEQQPQSPQLTAKDSFEIASAENKTLETILHSIQSIDTARQNELIQWIITDRTIRSRVISALRKESFRIAPNSVAELTVTQKPPTPNSEDMALLRIVIEQVGIYGEPNIRRVLGSALYDEINSRSGYEFTLISTAPEQDKIQFIAMKASLYGGDIIFKSGFGFGVNLGDDYVGYPFWLPGTIGTYGLVNNGQTDLRVGIEWPLGQSGVQPFTLSQGLSIRERKLIGAMAFDAELKQELAVMPEQSGKLGFGLEFRNSFTPSLTSIPSDPTGNGYGPSSPYRTGSANGSINGGSQDSLFYLALSAHAYISYQFPNQSLRGAYFQVGGGIHSIQPVTILPPYGDTKDPNISLNLVDRQNFFDPLVKIGYVHTGTSGDEYGLSIQYSNTLLSDAWVRIFSWLELEAKYSTVIGRDPYSWEWKDYVMISPKIILNF
jgi:hypothetical protein